MGVAAHSIYGFGSNRMSICILVKKLGSVIPLFAIGEFFLFATQDPVNFVTLWSVTPVLRPLSMAISTVLIHIFGDVPSAPIVGAFQVSCMVALFFPPVLTSLHKLIR
jgi:hypothetical protein